LARLSRLNLSNIPQHVVQRGNNRQVCFFNDTDYAVYLDKLKEYCQKYKVAVHSYALMANELYISNLLSEELIRQQLADILKISQKNNFELLYSIGRDCNSDCTSGLN